MLNSKQKQAYLDNPNTCPYCGSEELFRRSVAHSNRTETHRMECAPCAKQWDKIYSKTTTLTAIEEVEE